MAARANVRAQVDRSAVGIRNRHGLDENDLEQQVDVLLRRERDPDLGKALIAVLVLLQPDFPALALGNIADQRGGATIGHPRLPDRQPAPGGQPQLARPLCAGVFVRTGAQPALGADVRGRDEAAVDKPPSQVGESRTRRETVLARPEQAAHRGIADHDLVGVVEDDQPRIHGLKGRGYGLERHDPGLGFRHCRP